LQMYRVSPC